MSQELFTPLAVEHIMPGDEVLDMPSTIRGAVGQRSGTIKQVCAASGRPSFSLMFDQQGEAFVSEAIPAGTSFTVYHGPEDSLRSALRAAQWRGSLFMSHKTVYALTFPRAKVLIDGPGSDGLFAAIIFFHDGHGQVVTSGAAGDYRLPLDRLREALGRAGIAVETLVWAEGIGPEISTL